MFEFNITEIVQMFTSLDYYDAIPTLVTTTYLELFIFTIGIVAYSVFIWLFYKNLSKRDLFELDLDKYDLPEVKWKRLKKVGSTFLYILKYGIILPLYVAVWFVILSVFLFIMTKNIGVREIILMSISLVSAVRISSYLSEDLSEDLAKVVPFALLAIYLSDPTFFSWPVLMTRLEATPALGWEILNFLSFSILLEWGLRILHSLKLAISPEEESEESE